MQNMLEGLACFAIAAVALSLAGTAILGISCFLANRLFEVGRIEVEETPNIYTPQSAIEKSDAFDSSNPYSVGSVGTAAALVPRRIYPEVPSKLALFLIELGSFAAFVALIWLGTSTLTLGNRSQDNSIAALTVWGMCWFGTCGLKAALLSRYFEGTNWKIVSAIIIDQAIWVVSVVALYVGLFVVIIVYAWITGGFGKFGFMD